MNKEILYEILNAKSESFSSAEIEAILNDELDKSPEEMDTDLVDLCLDALNTVDEEKVNKRKRKIKIGRILLAAVIFITAVGICIPVCAKFFNIHVPEGIVTFYGDYFYVDISNESGIKDISARLQRDGLDDVVLPETMFDPETLITDYNYENNSNPKFEFSFKNDNVNGYVMIEKYDEYDFFSGKGKVSSEFENVEYFDVNGISVLVFGNDDQSFIYYAVDKIDYSIFLNCDYKTACQIAKTL